MRVYLSKQESELVMDALTIVAPVLSREGRELAKTVRDRMELCKELQNSENRAKKKEW